VLRVVRGLGDRVAIGELDELLHELGAAAKHEHCRRQTHVVRLGEVRDRVLLRRVEREEAGAGIVGAEARLAVAACGVCSDVSPAAGCVPVPSVSVAPALVAPVSVVELVPAAAGGMRVFDASAWLFPPNSPSLKTARPTAATTTRGRR